jgi:uncharacterized phage protein (predicted DNA packaging)
MILTLEEVKSFLRIDYNDEDSLLQIYIDGAEAYLYNATGIIFDNTNNLAKLYCFCLISDWYENRNFATDIKNGNVNEKVRYTLQSILLQLQLSEVGDTNG